MKILIVGLGYVGTTLFAAIQSKFKNSYIVGLDKSKILINNFKKYSYPTYELNLNKYFRLKNSNKLNFVTKLKDKEKFDFVIICVGTPLNQNKEINNSILFKSIKQVKKSLHENSLLIVRSSVKVGTMELIKKKFFKKNFCSFAYCPERTIEGNAVKEIMKLPQLIGTEDKISKFKANLFFSKLTKKIINFNSYKEPEFVKLMDNYHRDTKFAFANEISIICDKLGINAKNLIQKANYEFERNNIPFPGPVGGPCLSKDPYILMNSIKKNNLKTRIYSRDTNENFVNLFINKILKEIELKKKNISKISLLGITFKGKPDTNDIRNSTAITIINRVKKKFPKIKIYIYDKFVDNNEIKRLNCLALKKAEDCFIKFDLCIVHGNNNYIKNLNINKISNKMKKNSVIYDIWNNFNVKKINIEKTLYKGVGF